METINRGEAITFDDGKEYYVVDILHENNKKYVYLISDDEEVMLGEEIVENGEISVETLDDQNMIKDIISKMLDNK
jgi:hypothetical protein